MTRGQTIRAIRRFDRDNILGFQSLPIELFRQMSDKTLDEAYAVAASFAGYRTRATQIITGAMVDYKVQTGKYARTKRTKKATTPIDGER